MKINIYKDNKYKISFITLLEYFIKDVKNMTQDY